MKVLCVMPNGHYDVVEETALTPEQLESAEDDELLIFAWKDNAFVKAEVTALEEKSKDEDDEPAVTYEIDRWVKA